jgi:hypothetical protein
MSSITQDIRLGKVTAEPIHLRVARFSLHGDGLFDYQLYVHA